MAADASKAADAANSNQADARQEANWEGTGPALFSPSPTYRSSADGRLVSLSRSCPGLKPAAFLRQALGSERFYWEDIREGIVYAGFGLAVNLMAWGEERFHHIQEQARALFGDAVLLNNPSRLAAPRLFGGFSFRDDFTPDNTWSVYHPAHFVLPHYQLVQQGEEVWLTINTLLGQDEKAEEALPWLQEALEARAADLLQAAAADATKAGETQSGERPKLKSVSYPMSFTAWQTMVDEARAQFETTALKKVVLARASEARFDSRVDVDGALAYLNQTYTNCYRFLFEPRPYHAFFGATPELLAQVNGSTVSSMALAGSIRRSADPLEDAALGQQLIHNPKERQEHQFVVVSLLQRLALVTSKLDISPQPGLYRLHNIQHLYTPVRGDLLEAKGVIPVVEILHPTPALGGSPRELALKFISESEPIPRGWYAGPIGWIDNELNGAFSVAIRCAVSQEKRVWMYAGAGIVDDSDAVKEWEETALKFSPMFEALGIDAAALTEFPRNSDEAPGV